jgi:multiple sugar transport system permease protein
MSGRSDGPAQDRVSGLAAATRASRPKRRRPVGTTIFYAIAIIVAAGMLTPLLTALLRSLQQGTNAIQPIGLGMLATSTFDNYAQLLGKTGDLLPYVGNSIIVGVGAAVLATLCGALAGYAFTRYTFRGSNVVFIFFLSIIMVPFQALVIPLLSVLDDLHLADSWTGLILVDATYALPFCVFIMRNTFVETPRELEEAAQIDGANGWQTLVLILRPLILPGVVSAGLFAFLFSWTEFLGAVTFLSTQSKFTLPVQLLNLELGTQGVVNYGFLEAGAVIAAIPCVVLYFLLQRYYVAGLVAGSVKG